MGAGYVQGETPPGRGRHRSGPRRPAQQGQGKWNQGDLRYLMLFTFRGKKIVRIEIVMHEREALEAVGLSEQDAHADS